jgi:hypothetical protein
VNGERRVVKFDALAGDAWHWCDLGVFEAAGGRLEVKVHDDTGWFGRFAAVLITPPEMLIDPLLPLQEARRRYRGNIETERLTCDVLVVGGGVAGSCAAIAAARHGARTILIDDHRLLGGNASDELGVPIASAVVGQRHGREAGIVEEIQSRVFQAGSTPRYPSAVLPQMMSDANVFVISPATVTDAHVEGDIIKSVAAVRWVDGVQFTIEATQIIDCSGDGWVGFYAGADHRIGREASSEHGESLAPTESDTRVMSGCLLRDKKIAFSAAAADHPVYFNAPNWAAHFDSALVNKYRIITKLTAGMWWLELEQDCTEPLNFERSRDSLLRLSVGYWDYIKNRHPNKKATNLKIEKFAFALAKRESRRFLGPYVLTQTDVQSGRHFPDAIAFGGWPIDLHNPAGIESPDGYPYEVHAPASLYSIPLRCIYSRNRANLWMGGRNGSYTHVALGSVRIQGTLGLVGQAAGTAAALCVRLGRNPSELSADDVEGLRAALVRDDLDVPKRPERDPKDKAQDSRCVASSSANRWIYPKALMRPRNIRPNLSIAQRRGGALFDWQERRTLQSVSMLLINFGAKLATVEFELKQFSKIDDLGLSKPLVTGRFEVPAGKRIWATSPLAIELDSGRYAIILARSDGVACFWNSSRPGCISVLEETAESKFKLFKALAIAFATKPELYVAFPTTPELVINGFKRPVQNNYNGWQSDPDAGLPQWLKLEFERPSRMDVLEITFDTDLDNVTAWFGAAPAELVRDYAIFGERGSHRIPLAHVVDNSFRFRRHKFRSVWLDSIVIEVRATHGLEQARVFEVRCYDSETSPAPSWA